MFRLLIWTCIFLNSFSFELSDIEIDKNIHDIDNYDINLVSQVDGSYNINAVFYTKIYKKVINDITINSMPPIIKTYPKMLRDILERHIYSKHKNSAFFSMIYNQDRIELSFIVDLDYIKENIKIELLEFTQETFEQKIDERLNGMNLMLFETIENNKPDIYYNLSNIIKVTINLLQI